MKQKEETKVLKPGEQALSNANGIKLIENVDLDYVMAWKSGEMQIDNGDIKKLFPGEFHDGITWTSSIKGPCQKADLQRP